MGSQLPLKWAQPPVFDSCLLWPNGWMDEDATWYGSRPRPRPHCIRRGCSSSRKGHSSPPPLFGPCLLWPRSPISATAKLLLALSVISFLFFLFVTRIYRERLNGFALNSQGRRVWSLARMSLKVKVRSQRSRSPGTKNAHQGLKTRSALPSPLAATEWNALAANDVTQQRTAAFRRFGDLRAVYVW